MSRRRTLCHWKQADNWGDSLDLWETDCGHAFTFIDGGPADNGILYCCYCGKKVTAVPFVPPVEEDDV